MSATNVLYTISHRNTLAHLVARQNNEAKMGNINKRENISVGKTASRTLCYKT